MTLIRSFKKSPRPRKKSKDSQKSKKSTDSDASKDKQQTPLKRQTSNVSKSDIALDVNANVVVSKQAGNDSPPETERKAEVVEVKKGSLELDNVPHIDACAALSPRTHDDIPVSTVFAEEKARQSTKSESEERRSTHSKASSKTSEAKRKISRESAKSATSTTSSSNLTKPATEAEVAMATKLKKELEDTISELLAAAAKAELYLTDDADRETMSKDDADTIHLFVGQTRLLCQDKLGKQFRNLCLKTLGDDKIKPGETRPTVDDLVGFWEMVNIQVDTTREKLTALHAKRENGWKAPETKAETKTTTPPKPKKKVTPKTNSARSAAATEKAKARDAERKARLAAMRAKTRAAKEEEEANTAAVPLDDE